MCDFDCWQELRLYNNQIGDAGVTALANACAKGSLAQLTVRLLSNTGILATETRHAVSFWAEIVLCRLILTAGRSCPSAATKSATRA